MWSDNGSQIVAFGAILPLRLLPSVSERGSMMVSSAMFVLPMQ
jgi:hypothetical protein